MQDQPGSTDRAHQRKPMTPATTPARTAGQAMRDSMQGALPSGQMLLLSGYTAAFAATRFSRWK